MCGIVGYISLNNSISSQQLMEATSVVSHRGPDAEGFYFSEDAKVGFGHRRLSILDLSRAANQPMFSADGRYVIVYNGELYNFKDLRQKLTDKGASLKTTSDTEVILELFAQFGTSAFEWFNGMFSFAIYDSIKKNITLCRDHAGIKPLFVYCDESNIIFSSELKSIKIIKKGHLTINSGAIPYFLHLGFIPHPLTIFNGIEKFPAAHFLQFDIAQNNFHDITSMAKSFWVFESTIGREAITDESLAKRKLKTLLFDAVEKQLVSDVPIGTFLSGGVDSSLVTAVASTVSDQKINTFSIAIDEGKYDESKYALAVAGHLKTTHHEFNVQIKEVLEIVNDLLPTYDEPFGDSSSFPTMILSRLAKQHVTVALSGDGGDELFMGYGTHLWANRMDHPIVRSLRWPIHMASKIMSNRYQRAGEVFAYPVEDRRISHIFSAEQYYFNENELKEISQLPFNFETLNRTKLISGSCTKAEAQSIWDFNYYLGDELLVKLDRASMRYSLETRVPLLDYRIVEFAYNLHQDLKMKNGTMKYLIKEVLYDYVPKNLFDRPKWGFTIPISKWLKTDLAYLLDTYTARNIIEKYNYVNYDNVNELKRQYLAGKDSRANRLWLIIILHWWLEENL